MSKIDITNGWVELKDFIDYYSFTQYQNDLMGGQEIKASADQKQADFQDLKINFAFVNQAMNNLILNLIIRAEIDQKEVEINENIFRIVPADDFQKIAETVRTMIEKIQGNSKKK